MSETIITAAEYAPNAVDAYNGALIIDKRGDLAIKGFMVDPLDSASTVELDQTVEPPVLHLRNVLGSILFGYYDTSKAEFVQYDHGKNQTEHIISADYVGPGSEVHIR